MRALRASTAAIREGPPVGYWWESGGKHFLAAHLGTTKLVHHEVKCVSQGLEGIPEGMPSGAFQLKPAVSVHVRACRDQSAGT